MAGRPASNLSLIEQAIMAAGGADELLSALTPEERVALPYLWGAWGRPTVAGPDGTYTGQFAPDGSWSIWEYMAGRANGKTRAGSEWAIEKARECPGSRGALVAATAADVWGTMLEGESGIIACSPPWFRPKVNTRKRRLLWPNGSMAFLYSSERPGRLRGPQHGWAWCDEMAAWRNMEPTFDNLMMGLRLGNNPQVLITTTPRPLELLRDLRKRASTVVTVGKTTDNRSTPVAYIRQILERYQGTTLGQQELDGLLFDQEPGALWARGLIERLRVRTEPKLIRVAVGVDPAASDKDHADKAGICAVGLGEDGHAYILEDATLKASPDKWARRAVQCHYDNGADAMVEEVTKGGKLVSSLILLVDDKIKIISKGGNRSKRMRAEPVSAMYEQGKVHHVGLFAELENQMCTWKPGDKSPNNLDAMVYAVSELFWPEESGGFEFLG